MSARMQLRNPADGLVFLERWGWESRWFGVFIHRMDGPDYGRALHDHPWAFSSVVLWGGYTEECCTTGRACAIAAWAESVDLERRGYLRRRRWLSVRSTSLKFAHRITALHRSPTWTLVVRGPRRRGWGFYTPTGFVDQEMYLPKIRPRAHEASDD